MNQPLAVPWSQFLLLLVGVVVCIVLALTLAVFLFEHRTIFVMPRPKKSAKILVFGAYASDAGLSCELQHRLNHAVRLREVGLAVDIAVSGGYSEGVDETTAMKSYLLQSGVNSLFVQEIRPGHSTRVTIHSLITAPQTANIPVHWIAVSSGYHALRIRLWGWAYRLSLQVSCPGWRPNVEVYRWRQRLREVFAILCILPVMIRIRFFMQRSVDGCYIVM